MDQTAATHERTGNAGATPAFRPVIFVVEDDADIARLISHNLQAAGFEVQSFVSGASVISEAVRETPALFLLDVMLTRDRRLRTLPPHPPDPNPLDNSSHLSHR